MADFLPVTKIPRSGLPEFALVCGDPRRALRISEYIGGSQIGHNREYTTYRGSWHGTDLVVSSHGVGGPGAICMFQELVKAGVTTIIRVGTCGGVVQQIDDGDLVIATGCIRDDGITYQMVPPEYPAFSTPEVILALQRAAIDVGHPWHRGLVWTKALFFPGVLTPPSEAYARAGLIAVEMELSALLVMATMLGVRAGGILVVDGNPAKRKEQSEYDPHRPVVEEAVGKAIEVALGAVEILAGSPKTPPVGTRQIAFR
jgi:uridine phosphorylase